MQDLRYALRTLRRAPGFAAIAVVTIALGIGANTAIFSLVDAVILKPLPFREPSRLIAAWDAYQAEIAKIGVSSVEMTAWSQQTDLFESSAWYRSLARDFSLTAPGVEAVTVHSTFVSPGFFELFGVAPTLGSPLDTSLPNSATLSQRLWRTRFSSDPAIVGRSIRLDGHEFIVAGVMPANFQFPDFAELWLSPGPLVGDITTNPVRHGLGFVARMRADVTERQAAVRLESISRRLAAEHAKTSVGWRSYVAGLQDDLTAKTRPALIMLAGAVAFVLLIACANVANL
ncbi:MAG TPA: ABC transporter permease, partial [Bryobacteraceae bacterium]|nr:ABC transporter permease [Bryobacteraceae bacterium]